MLGTTDCYRFGVSQLWARLSSREFAAVVDVILEFRRVDRTLYCQSRIAVVFVNRGGTSELQTEAFWIKAYLRLNVS
jgi:hypothetical protein